MNMNLGAPYEAMLKRIVSRGYAGNFTEAARQAIKEYDQKLEEEEMRLVHKAVESEMEKIDSGREKTYSHEQVKKMLGL